MFASILALAIVAQIAPDGLTINPNIPNDLVTWRWTQHDGKAALGWGRLNDAGLFVAVQPAPEAPCYPASKAKPNAASEPTIGDLPKYATNGVEAEKIDGQGLTLRASDKATAEHARDVLYESTAGDPAGRIKIPKLAPKITPDLADLAPYAVAFGLFGVAGVVFVARSLQSR